MQLSFQVFGSRVFERLKNVFLIEGSLCCISLKYSHCSRDEWRWKQHELALRQSGADLWFGASWWPQYSAGSALVETSTYFVEFCFNLKHTHTTTQFKAGTTVMACFNPKTNKIVRSTWLKLRQNRLGVF